MQHSKAPKRLVDISTADSNPQALTHLHVNHQLNKQFSSLSNPNTFSSQSSSIESEYKNLPNYEQIWYFEEDLTDEEFLQVMVEKFQAKKAKLSYKVFKNEFLPKHRKPTFKDYARFRKLENLMLE